jgi:hypothetical protein
MIGSTASGQKAQPYAPVAKAVEAEGVVLVLGARYDLGDALHAANVLRGRSPVKSGFQQALASEVAPWGRCRGRPAF